MLRTNVDKLVKISVFGEVVSPVFGRSVYNISAGHGSGVTTLFTSSNGKIIPKIDAKAKIASILKLRANI
jgi:hypothetical protein